MQRLYVRYINCHENCKIIRSRAGSISASLCINPVFAATASICPWRASYDNVGMPYSLIYNNGTTTTTYYYITNLQGDVM